MFELPKAGIKYSNVSREERNAIRLLADNRSIIIKKADKRSCIVIWGRNDYLMEAEKQLIDEKVYQEVSNRENILSKLAEMSNKMFSNLKKRGYITDKKTTNFGKLYFLTKIHKRLNNVPGRPVISNCVTPTEKMIGIFRLSLETFNAEGVVVH